MPMAHLESGSKVVLCKAAEKPNQLSFANLPRPASSALAQPRSDKIGVLPLNGLLWGCRGWKNGSGSVYGAPLKMNWVRILARVCIQCPTGSRNGRN